MEAQIQVQTLLIDNQDTLILSIVVLFLGYFITRKITFLSRNNIPAAVTGGLFCSLIVAAIYFLYNLQINFSLELRNLLLYTFFSTIGLSAKLSTLKNGGKALVILLVIAVLLLIVQNIIGISVAILMDSHPAYGLLAGSISFSGGHGTAIAWGEVAKDAGLPGGDVIGIACATFGLIAGGLIGGPVAGRLIEKHRLKQASDSAQPYQVTETQDIWTANVRLENILMTVLLLALCVTLGSHINAWLAGLDLTLPGFLTAMFVGIILTNLADLFKLRLNDAAINRASELSLQLFLSMSLMSMQLWLLANAFGPLLLVLMLQMVVITLFAVYIVFRLMGKDYDASVIAAGFMGLGLGATPVAIANMQAITEKYAPSPKAFLVVPLVGAFFIDISNAAVIKSFLLLPLLQVIP